MLLQIYVLLVLLYILNINILWISEYIFSFFCCIFVTGSYLLHSNDSNHGNFVLKKGEPVNAC